MAPSSRRRCPTTRPASRVVALCGHALVAKTGEVLGEIFLPDPSCSAHAYREKVTRLNEAVDGGVGNRQMFCHLRQRVEHETNLHVQFSRNRGFTTCVLQEPSVGRFSAYVTR